MCDILRISFCSHYLEIDNFFFFVFLFVFYINTVFTRIVTRVIITF